MGLAFEVAGGAILGGVGGGAVGGIAGGVGGGALDYALDGDGTMIFKGVKYGAITGYVCGVVQGSKYATIDWAIGAGYENKTHTKLQTEL